MVLGTPVETSATGEEPDHRNEWWLERWMPPRPASGARCAIVESVARRCPSVAGRPDERGDLPNQPRQSQQPDVDVFFSVAALETGTPECARAVRFARIFEAAGSRGERADAQMTPMPTDSKSFFSARITAGAQPRVP